MTEERLQMDIVVAHSQRYPKKQGQLFHISNERAHKIAAFKAKAVGIVAGASDLLYFCKRFQVATELKIKGSRHKRSSIEKQVWWGKVFESKGTKKKPNVWRLCMTVSEAMSCYKGDFKGMTIEDVEKLLNSVKTKTIKF